MAQTALGKRHRTDAGPRIVPKAAPVDAAGEERRRGRGAVSNPSGRFETERREDMDDGWGVLEALPDFATTITRERPKTIITKNDSPDISFDRSINPYRGCEHGCIYCFARPTHSYMGLSAGLDFESKLFVKDGAAELLERELSARHYQAKPIAIGTNTDPYQPIERQHRIMRAVLDVLARTQHPVTIVTKNALVTRDIDLLAPMAEKGLAKVALSITTLDRKLARVMEPRASTPDKRLAALQQLSQAGIPTSVMFAPVIPALNDAEMEHVLECAREMGAREAGYVMLRLPLEIEDLFGQWLQEHFPDKYRHVMSLVRSLQDGKAYDSSWGQRQTGTGPYALLTARRFEIALKRLGLNARRLNLRCDLFQKPERKQATAQLSLF